MPDALAELRQRKLHWIQLRTFSRALGLAGLRVEHGIASIAELDGLRHWMRTPVNVNLAALGDSTHMQASVQQAHEGPAGSGTLIAVWLLRHIKA